MTVGDALRVAETMRPSHVERALRLRWLCELEGRILTEIRRERPERSLALAERLPDALPLSAPPPYDRVYWTYLVAMADLAESDTVAYSMSSALFREAYDAYARWYQRTGGRA